MAGLSFKVGADTTGLGKGLRRAEGMVGRFGNGVKKLGLAGLALGAGGAAVALAGMTVAVRGLNSALNLGGRLSDVADNTGLLAGQAMVLERAFQDAGLSGEKLQPTITKMQRSIVEGGEGLETYAKAFRAIGLSTEDLMAMSPAEQFEAIQKGISGLASPAERSARAMQIFGKSGSELGALFADKDALGKAAVSVGGQADIMNKNAKAFDRSADILGGISQKIEGFFVGMLGQVNSTLLPILEKMNKIDLAKYGAAAGRFISLIAEAFRQDALAGMFKDSMILAAKATVNALFSGLHALGASFAGFMIEGMQTAFSKIMDMSFWEGVLNMLKSGASYLESAAWSMRAALTPGKKGRLAAGMAESTMFRAGVESKVGMSQMSEAGDGKTLSDLLGDAVDRFKEAYAEAVENPLMDMAPELKRLNETIARLKKSVADAKKDEEPAPGEDAAPGGGKGLSMAGSIKSAVSSLQRVGGASLGGDRVNLDEDRNRMLKDIVRNTARPNVARFA